MGPHIGRQFLDTDLISLFGEVDPFWVEEQFDKADDSDFPGALWLLAATSDIIGFGTTVHMNHDGIFDADDPEDLILDTALGVKMLLTPGFETDFEAKWDTMAARYKASMISKRPMSRSSATRVRDLR